MLCSQTCHRRWNMDPEMEESCPSPPSISVADWEPRLDSHLRHFSMVPPENCSPGWGGFQLNRKYCLLGYKQNTKWKNKNKLKGKDSVNSLLYMSSFLLGKLPSLKPHGSWCLLATSGKGPASPYFNPWWVEWDEQAESQVFLFWSLWVSRVGEQPWFSLSRFGLLPLIPHAPTQESLICKLRSWTRVSQRSPAVACSGTLLPTERREKLWEKQEVHSVSAQVALSREEGTWGDLKHPSPWLHSIGRLPAHHHLDD